MASTAILQRNQSAPSTSTAIATSVQNNTISGISLSTAGNGRVVFNGIFCAAGRFDVGTVTGNKIGSLDGSSTITITLMLEWAGYHGCCDFSFHRTSNSIIE